MPAPLTVSLVDEALPEPCPAQFNIAAYALAAAAGAAREREALRIVGRESWSYGELDLAVRRIAAGLAARGIGRGDRVALRIGSSVAFPLLFLGAIAAGAVPVPTSTQLTAGEFARIAEDLAPRLVVADEALETPEQPGAERVTLGDWRALMAAGPAPYAETAPDDPAFLVYTSGTGGRPKGVLHAQRAAWARRMMWAGWYGLGPGDRVLHAGAFNWTYTLGTGLLDPWAAGATAIVAADRPEPGDWPGIIAGERATIFAAVPGVYRQILRGAGDLRGRLGALRHGLTAGEKLPEPVRAAWGEATGLPLYEALGMSEVSTYCSSSPAVAPRPGAVGRPQRGRRLAVIDERGAPLPVGEPGLLAVSRRDPGLMLGYWRRAEETEAAFRGEWFVTGDRAAMDGEGYITHLGRADELMTALGYRISPQEVEEALAPHPGIAEIAVAELPVRPDLALVTAFVVPAGQWPGQAALESFAAGRLAAYKRPKLWIEVAALPRTANGKLLRRALVEAHRRDRA